MKVLMRLNFVLGITVISLTVFFLGLTHTTALAVPIVFNLGYGGTVSYDGLGSSLQTIDGVVESVSNGIVPSDLPIDNGSLNFSTGAYTDGSSTSDSFINHYAAGGSFTITGDIGGGVTTLLSGSFADGSTFNCCSGSLLLPLFVSSFNGLLSVTYVDLTLAGSLGFILPPTGGGIGQVQIFFGSAPEGPGMAFQGIQGGGAVDVVDTASVPVPEPASLLLLGSGLIALSLWGRHKLTGRQATKGRY